MNDKVKQMLYCAMFAALTAILAQIKIDLPGLVPLTLQTMAIYLMSAMMKPKYAMISALVYVFMGAVGLPVFAGFTGGIGVLVGPTGGYIYSFPIMAFVISRILVKKNGYGYCLFAMGIGTVLCYVIGTIWFMYVTNNTLMASLTWCVFPFLLGDGIKIILATSLFNKLPNR